MCGGRGSLGQAFDVVDITLDVIDEANKPERMQEIQVSGRILNYNPSDRSARDHRLPMLVSVSSDELHADGA